MSKYLQFTYFNSKPVEDEELWYLISSVSMASLSRSITLVCSISKKKMRSDHLKKHWFAKQKNFDFKVATVVRGFLKIKDSKASSNWNVESEILANDKLLDGKIELGEQISKFLTNKNTVWFRVIKRPGQP